MPRKRADRTIQIIRAMYQVLPAGSQKQITDRVSTLIGEPLKYWEVNNAIAILRSSPPELFGWTIFHCLRGPTADGRYFAVRVDEDGIPLLTDEQARFFALGVVGTLGHTHTMMGIAADCMKIAAAVLPEPGMRRFARRMVLDMKYISDKAWDMREDCRQDLVV